MVLVLVNFTLIEILHLLSKKLFLYKVYFCFLLSLAIILTLKSELCMK